jgi:hypothetical protein
VRPPNATDVGKALGASKALLGGDPLEALSWLQGVSRVRAGASRLSAALAYAGALGRNAAFQLKVAQLPFVAGERWVALKPEAGKGFPAGKISLVVHLPRPFKPVQPLAGLMLDEWTETVPEAEVTTGLAFNYDAPGARPPQAVVLAVHPRPDPDRWDLDTLLATVNETAELAKLRTLSLKEIEGFAGLLPALYLPTNYTRDVPSFSPKDLLANAKAANVLTKVATGILGKD